MSLKVVTDFIKHLRLGFYQYLLLGFLFASILNKIQPTLNLLLAFISWVLLCMGSGLINNYYDRDRKSIAFLRNPPKATKSILYGSFVFKILGLLIAISYTNVAFIGLYILGAIMSFLYSHKKVRLKSNGWVALFINASSGAATYIVASTFASALYTGMNFIGTIASGLTFGSVYLLMQIHQVSEDKRRGDKSIALKLGQEKTLKISASSMFLSGILCLYLISQVNITLSLVGAAFFLVMICYISYWIKQKRSIGRDYEIMNKIVSYPVAAITLVLLVFYILQHT